MRRVLVFGGSGQIGDGLLPLLRAADCEVLAVSRQPRSDGERLHWIVGALDDVMAQPKGHFDAVFSLGPLDAFARWHARVGVVAPRVVAFGSTSVATKAASADPAERDVAQRLRVAEEHLFADGVKHGSAIIVLRPTLIYGRGRDRTLTRIAAFAQWRGFFALPRNANGLRQPVHVDDLARAAFAVAGAGVIGNRAYDLPGGEVVAFDAMVQRTLACLPNHPRLLRVPSPIFRAMIAGARALRTIDAVTPAMLDRLHADWVFDAGDAQRDFGYAPRAFAPEAEMFVTNRASGESGAES